MEDHCQNDNATKSNIENFLGHPTSPSRVVFLMFIFLFWVLTIAHDVMLLSGLFESNVTKPMYVGAAAIICQGIACAALFIWAMGATEVFAANAGGGAMCYYQLPPLESLF